MDYTSRAKIEYLKFEYKMVPVFYRFTSNNFIVCSENKLLQNISFIFTEVFSCLLQLFTKRFTDCQQDPVQINGGLYHISIQISMRNSLCG